MPSCSSKPSVLRENEYSDSLEKVYYSKKEVLRLLVDATCNSHLLCSIHSVNNRKICFKRDNLSNRKYLCKKCQVPIYLRNLIKPGLCVVDLIIFFKCEVQRIRNILQQTYYLVVLQLFNHNVICLLIIYVLLRLLTYFIFLKKLKLGKSSKLTLSIFKINCVSYGNKFVTVMEVDEKVKEVSFCINNLPNGDKLNEVNSLSDVDKSDNVRSTVIKENQIMIKTECPPLNNGGILGNSIDVKIKEEIKDNNETVTNGDVITNCHNSCKDSKESVDLVEVSQTAKELSIAHIKDKPNGSNEEVLANAVKWEHKEKKSNDVINNQQIKIEEKVGSSNSKSSEVSSIKDKPREKDVSLNNNSLNHSSSSSSKKYDSQSRSHQSTSSSSSSSSRHKYKDSRDEKHKSSSSSSSSSSKNNELSSSSRREEDRSKSDSRSKSRSCHHKPEEKCHCKSHHHSHHHSKKSKKLQSVKTQCTPDEIAFELREKKFDSTNPYFTRVPWVPHPQLVNLKYGRFYRIEVDRNGGASVCHLYMDEISHLTEAQMKECAMEFVKLSYSEDENECAYHVMGIVHGAASYLPDLVDYMADHYPTLIVKTGSLASRDNHTTTMSQYRDEVYKTYSNGTFRYAPLDQLSICGVLGEEVGAYFPDFVARLEQSPFMKPVMPWSSLSVVETDNPRESNDGPIFWVRPGEQMLPANEALKESARPKKRRNNELDNLFYIGGARSSEARESLFMDRTKAHADQVGVDYGISNTAPTAAVGVLKAVNCGHPEHGNRATKDVVAFHAQDYNELLEILMLDLYEPPQTQCTKWIEVSKLNTLRREGIRYAHLQLHDNDVYYLPRKIIHQFQTISSVASVAWHIRYKDYFSILGAPNLHTPTGINKGQVFYEKKNVAVYCPPVCENDLLAAVANVESGLKTPKKVDRLKEYSPFKHSPRKMHKYQSKKQSVSVSPHPNGAAKSEPGTPIAEQEKKSSGSSKKRERSKSDERSSPAERRSKRDLEEESRKTSEKSDASHGRRSSEDRTPSKKERKSPERHSSQRKEVKNLDSEFGAKKEKSSREKSPKSKHERKRSDESKHNGSSKSRRHEESSKGKSSSSSSKHEKSREHGSNGGKTKEKSEGEGIGVKRKHEESPSGSPAKKIKEENPDPGVENGRQSPKQEPESSGESQPVETGNADPNCVVIKEENVLESKPSEGRDEGEETRGLVNSVSEGGEHGGEDSGEKTPEAGPPAAPETNSQNDRSDRLVEFDLRQRVSYAGFIGQVPPFPLPPPPPPPPPPPSSPPADPPPPPPSPPVGRESPVKNSLSDSSPQESLPSGQPGSLQENGGASSKEKNDGHVKKVKKKPAKKGSESYDLLGDIMSKMDRKK